VSPERDEPIEDQDHELYEDVPPRSIFAATWFRVVLVVIVLGVVGAVAVPYVLDWMNPPPPPRMATTTRSPLTPPMAEERSGDNPSSDKPIGDKKDSTVVPAPVAPIPTTAVPAVPPARAESKSEARPSPPAPSAKPGAEPKAAAKAAAPETKRTPADATKGQSAMSVTDPASKPSATKSGAAKADAAPKGEAAATKPTAPKRVVAKATTPAAGAAAGGPYWVQIGAFKDAETAKRVAAKLREENFKVEESIKHIGGAPAAAPGAKASVPAPAPAGTDQYDVFVTGMSVEDLNRRLAGKGLAAEGSGGGGVVVKPSLPLRDAVALSKDLAVEGFKVQVRRAGAAASAPAIVSAPSAGPVAAEGGQALHRVRVGAFTDRAAAVAAARELESKGFKPYIARGDQ
jgi:hypothetical protein